MFAYLDANSGSMIGLVILAAIVTGIVMRAVRLSRQKQPSTFVWGRDVCSLRRCRTSGSVVLQCVWRTGPSGLGVVTDPSIG